jgi:hypothetical protein
MKPTDAKSIVLDNNAHTTTSSSERHQIPRINNQFQKPNTVMKTKISYSFFAAAMACGLAQAQTTAFTTPVGYVTQTLAAGKQNLLGLTVHGSTAFAGTLSSKPSPTSLEDLEANFNTALAAGTNIIEITGTGPNAGAIQEFITFTDKTITGLPASFVAALAGNEPYRVRPAATIANIFGSTNQAGLLAGNANTADLILVPNGTGGLDTFFYSNGGFTGVGWRKVGGGSTNFAAESIVYTDAFFVQRRGATNLSLVVSGEVKPDSTKVGISQVFNYTGTIFGAGVTLGNSGLTASVQQGNANTADLVQVPNGSGGFISYFYSNGGFTGIGWRLVGGGSVNQANVALTPGILINRRQAAFNATFTPSF